MNRKQELIDKLLAMQKAFIQREHSTGVDSEAYYSSDDELAGYQQDYTTLANELVDLAHEEKGSKR